MEHAVIMAGGGGTRLWPMSRRGRPKQLLPLVAGRSLLSLAVERACAMLPAQRVWIVTTAEMADGVKSAAGQLPADNILIEPGIRDTSNAIGLACMMLLRRDADARVGIFTADHVIQPTAKLAAAVSDAMRLADSHPQALVTLGVTPDRPHTGLGYIHRGEPIGRQAYRVGKFVEKPDLATAQRYLAEGDYYWNSGMFIWRARTLVDQFKLRRPEHAALLAKAADALARGDAAALNDDYARLPRISIDYALMEPAAQDGLVIVRELDCQWLDVGEWSVLSQANRTDEQGNLLSGSPGGPGCPCCPGSPGDRVVALDAAGSVVIADEPGRLLAVVGVENLVVVQSGKATLVVPKGRAQDVKKLLERIRELYGDEYD